MFLVVDIGGTHTRVGVSIDGQTLGDIKIFNTPQDYQQAIKQISDTALSLSQNQTIDQAVVGVAGTLNVERNSLTLAPHILDFVNQPLKKDLAVMLSTKVYLENDAALAALGEAHFGAGKNYGVVGFLTIGTGVGGARVVAGKLDPEFLNYEPGHRLYSESQLTLEEQISGSALNNRYHLDSEQINDPIIWNQVATDLFLALNKLSETWKPDIFILGGAVSQKIPLENLPLTFKVTLGELGAKSGLMGGLAYLQQLNN